MSLFRTPNPEPFVSMKDMDIYHNHEWNHYFIFKQRKDI